MGADLIWLLKAERLSSDQPEVLGTEKLPARLQLFERTRKRWRAQTGDQAILTRYQGDELQFFAMGTISRITTRPDEPTTYSELSENPTERALIIEAEISQLELLDESRLLSNHMFSLEKVSNFGQPWRHFRHRSALNEADLQTILEGRVAWDRSIFYGLLRQLPEPWRTLLELRAKLDSTSLHPEEPQQLKSDGWRPLNGIPILFELLERTALTPASLAADVATLSSQVFPPGNLGISMGSNDPNKAQESFGLYDLLAFSRYRATALKENFQRLREETLAAESEWRLAGWEGQWRPHRW